MSTLHKQRMIAHAASAVAVARFAERPVMPVMSNRACKLRLKWQSEQLAEQHADSRQAASLLVLQHHAPILPRLTQELQLHSA